MGLPRILLADDHTLLLDALEKLLSDEWNIVGKIHDGAALTSAVDELRPDVVVLDLGLPDGDGKDVIRRVREWSDVPIVVLSARDREAEKTQQDCCHIDDNKFAGFHRSTSLDE